MKHALLFALLLTLVLYSSSATVSGYQHGTVIRMHMGDCVLSHHSFMNTFGPPQAPLEEACPEYTLISEKVVFIIVGKSSKEFVPLAEVVDFRFQKNELAVRVDDDRKESKFVIKEMTLRSQWELIQQHIEEALKNESRESEKGSATANRY
jgi:hypothetical protein